MQLCCAGLLLTACHPPAPHASLEQRTAELRVAYGKARSQWPPAWIDPGVSAPELAPLPAMPFPANNPQSAAKTALGRLLFFDPRLSGSGQIACASCHDPQLGWADAKRFAIGFARAEGKMNTPSIANAGYESSLFWDGRAASLEAQIPGSLRSRVEMNTTEHRAARSIGSIPGYARWVTAAYGDARVDWRRLCDAIATYVRSIQLRDTPYDRFLLGDTDALSDAALRGLDLFRTRARCMNCHNGALLSDGQFHHLGTSFYGVGNFQGRYAASGQPSDIGRFRTPGLRGVTRTGPWMHNGLLNDLEGLLVIYNMGWWQNDKPDPAVDDALIPRRDPLIRPLHLGRQDLDDLKNFLDAMSPPPQYSVSPDLPGQARASIAAR